MKKIFLLLLLLLPTVLTSGEVDQIELKNLEGKWEGVGFFLLPVVHTKVNIEGAATFAYEPESERLRTSLVGEKFLFTYSDSGYLFIDHKTDSVSWEVWDNSGKHAYYTGVREGNMVRGERFKKKSFYEVKIIHVAPDTIDFKLTVKPEGKDQYERAVFNLWRIKD